MFLFFVVVVSLEIQGGLIEIKSLTREQPGSGDRPDVQKACKTHGKPTNATRDQPGNNPGAEIRDQPGNNPGTTRERRSIIRATSL